MMEFQHKLSRCAFFIGIGALYLSELSGASQLRGQLEGGTCSWLHQETHLQDPHLQHASLALGALGCE